MTGHDSFYYFMIDLKIDLKVEYRYGQSMQQCYI